MNRNVFDLNIGELETLIKSATELRTAKEALIAQKQKTENLPTVSNSPKTVTKMESDTEFVIPKKKAVKRKKTEQVKPITDENIYNNLEDESTLTTAESNDNTDSATIVNDKQKIAPIYLKDKEKWLQVSKLMKSKNINFTKCKLVSTGIQINPTTEGDYRKLNHVLENEKLQFYTYQLRSEKKLKIVIRGLIEELKEEEIKLNLTESGYPVDKVTRMRNRDQRPIPLVLVEIAREYKSIYDMQYCCDLAVTVEPLRTRTGIIQCHKCQLFGHVQKNCHINYKCMKCGDEHSTHLCTKPKTTPPKCANCGGEHLSTYIKCHKNPNNPDTKSKTNNSTPQQLNENVWARRIQERNSKQANEEKPQNSTSNVEEELAYTLGKMLLSFHKLNSTVEEKIEFLQNSEKIISLFKLNQK